MNIYRTPTNAEFRAALKAVVAPYQSDVRIVSGWVDKLSEAKKKMPGEANRRVKIYVDIKPDVKQLGTSNPLTIREVAAGVDQHLMDEGAKAVKLTTGIGYNGRGYPFIASHCYLNDTPPLINQSVDPDTPD